MNYTQTNHPQKAEISVLDSTLITIKAAYKDGKISLSNYMRAVQDVGSSHSRYVDGDCGFSDFKRQCEYTLEFCNINA